MPSTWDRIASRLLEFTLSLVVLASPWFFGAWETWWFWPFMTLLFLTGVFFAFRLTLSAVLRNHRFTLPRLGYTAILAWCPFLVYAVIRLIQADVWMDAERSFLLHSSAFLVAVIVAIGLDGSQRLRLVRLMLINYALIALYGIINHLVAHNSHVLWVKGFSQYQDGYFRATGCFFCPDHFSGLMEIGLGLALALIFCRHPSRGLRAGGLVMAGLSYWSIYLTRSRGGGIVAVLITLAAIFLATQDWSRPRRRLWHWGSVTVLAGLLTIIVISGSNYAVRFKDYPWKRLEAGDRGLMTAATLRAWTSAPWFGTGPGMHQNLWPHFAPSNDGDRALHRWPTYVNNTFHSYESHNDWAQLLEEYGVVGFALLCGAVLFLAHRLSRRWSEWSASLAKNPARPELSPAWIIPGALLAGLAMGVHSLADFNLQMPATTWQLATIAGLAIATGRHHARNSSRSRPDDGDRTSISSQL